MGKQTCTNYFISYRPLSFYLVCRDKYSILFFFSLLYFGGCANQEAFIQDLNISAPINQTAIHFTDEQEMKNRIRISARISSNPKEMSNSLIDSHTHVNGNNTMVLDTSQDGAVHFHGGNNPYNFQGSNFHWTYPSNTAAADIDIVLSQYFILNGGISYSSANHEEYINQSAGIAWLSFGPDLTLRAEAGLHFAWLAYDLSYVVLTTSGDLNSGAPDEASVEMGTAHGRQRNTNFYSSVTLNTNHDDWLINGIVKVSMDNQELIDYPLRGNSAVLSATNSATLFTITPALAFSAGGSGHIIIGCSFIQNLAAKNDNNPFISVPVMQIDWDL